MYKVDVMIKGSIDPQWADWLDGLRVLPMEKKETLISGELPDQAALFGVLSRLNNLGLTLLSVRVEEKPGVLE